MAKLEQRRYKKTASLFCSDCRAPHKLDKNLTYGGLYSFVYWLFELFMGLFCLANAVYPIKEFRQVVVTGMAAVPG